MAVNKYIFGNIEHSHREGVPSGYVKIAIENDHWNSEFSH